MAQLVIDPRYEGIPGVVHGGYPAGVAAKELDGPVTVTLTRVVQPGSSVTLERHDAEVVLRVGGEVAATAVPSQFETTAPRALTAREAEIASERYPGFHHRDLSWPGRRQAGGCGALASACRRAASRWNGGVTILMGRAGLSCDLGSYRAWWCWLG